MEGRRIDRHSQEVEAETEPRTVVARTADPPLARREWGM